MRLYRVVYTVFERMVGGLGTELDGNGLHKPKICSRIRIYGNTNAYSKTERKVHPRQPSATIQADKKRAGPLVILSCSKALQLDHLRLCSPLV